MSTHDDKDLVEIIIGEREKSVRRTTSELILDILEAIPVDEVDTIDNICKAVGARWGTTRNYVELILLIQAAPRVIHYKMGSKGRKVYRRDPGKVQREIPP